MRGMAMKLAISTFGLLLAASLAYGQAQATTPPPAKPAAKAAAPAKPPAKHKAAHKTAPAAAASEAAPAPEGMSAAAPPGGKRDPFVNPIQAVLEGRNERCQGGKRCLVVTEIVLRGVVKSPNGLIAVVENAAQRTYFLHENDAIFNGYVQKITPDSVIFREHFTDNLGHDQLREVVKTVNAPVV